MNSNESIDHWSDSEQFFTDGCPFCKSKNFLKGSHEGLAINFKCAQCGAIFNDIGTFGVALLSNSKINKQISAD